MARLRFLIALTSASALSFAAREACATGSRHCQAQLVAADGTPRESRSAIGATDAVILLGECVDSISAFPTVREVVHTPAELVVIGRTCSSTALPPREPGVVQQGTFVALPVETPAGATRTVHRFTGTLTDGHYRIEWAGTEVLRFVVGQPPPLPTCAPYVETPPVWVPQVTVGGADTYAPETGSTKSAAAHARTWDERRGWTWEVGAGGFFGGAARSPERRLEIGLGGLGVFGVHRMVEYGGPPSSKGGDGFLPQTDGTRWCVPIGCAFVGMLFMPPGVLFGNELGVDVRFAVGPGLARATLRPVFRYAAGAIRTPSLFGFLLPEAGVHSQDARGTSAAVAWSLFPIDWRFAGDFALGVDPLRAGLLFGPRASGELGSELTVRYAP